MLPIVQCLKHVNVLLGNRFLVLILLLSRNCLVSVCVPYTLYPIVKHGALLWRIWSLGHWRVLLLTSFAFWTCGSLCNLYILSDRLRHELMTCINPIHSIYCSDLVISCWSLMGWREESDAFLAGDWVLPSFCLLLYYMRLDNLLWDCSLLLRLIDNFLGTAFIPNGLFARL